MAHYMKPLPETYAEKRAEEYPGIGDQLDTILKAFNDLRMKGTKLPQEMDDLIGTWLAVKKKHPKPEGE